MLEAKTISNLLTDLNPEQQAAVTHDAGPLLIVAGAGTGKTTVITRRVAWLIEKKLAEPEQILALTFTDKAAIEMEERIDLLLPTGYVNTWVSTFHAFGERVLKDYALEIGLSNDFRLLTTTEQWMLVRNNLDRFALDYYRPLGNPTRFIHALLTHFSRAKDEEIYPEDYIKFAESKKLNTGQSEYLKKIQNSKSKTQKIKNKKVDMIDNSSAEGNEGEVLRIDEVAQAYHIYQQLLLEKGCLDFGDLINYTLKLLRTRSQVKKNWQDRFKYILVDEFQDTNYAQYELIKLLAAPRNNITVVGDDDQSVYKFRGASISNILEFKRDYPKTKDIFLTKNYRSYQNILDTAYSFIQLNNPYRLEIKLAEARSKLSKKLVADRAGSGQVEYLAYCTADDEAAGVVDKIINIKNSTDTFWSDFAILVRANSSAPIFLQALKSRGVPFDFVANRGLYSEAIILDVVAYLKLLDNYHESEALYRVLTREPFLMPTSDIATLSYSAGRKTISLYESMKQASALSLSDLGRTIIVRVLAKLEEHAAYAREHSAVEVYVKVINDLGINDRVVHPALAHEAAYLNTFYQRIQRFELDTKDVSLASYLNYIKLELESGEDGQLPTDYEDGPETVKVITVHSAKGLEWKYVFLVQLVDRRFPSTERKEAIELPRELIKEQLPEGDIHLQEERRLFYVGLTRARDGLFVTRAEDYFGKTIRKASRFLHELGFVSKEAIAAPTSKVIKLAMPEVVTKPVSRYPIPESFSFSSVSAFRKCPLEYKYRYLLKLPSPGGPALSYGSTIHKTVELFLKLWQSRKDTVQADLFGKTPAIGTLPTFDELMELYKKSWIDDWYDSKQQKAEYYTKKGPAHLKNFYDTFVAAPPTTKYIEQFFKIGMGPYKFTGKIDRLDATPSGGAIIDYKTTGKPPTDLQKVDRDQLMIYQIAAQEFLHEPVISIQYWYLESNTLSQPFVASTEDLLALKSDYTKVIETIIQTVERNSFLVADNAATKHECKYRHLE